jgi:hypothetical protein
MEHNSCGEKRWFVKPLNHPEYSKKIGEMNVGKKSSIQGTTAGCHKICVSFPFEKIKEEKT